MERYIVSNFHRGVDQPKSQFHTQLQKLFSAFFYLFKRSYMYAIQVREVTQLLHHEVFVRSACYKMTMVAGSFLPRMKLQARVLAILATST